MVAAAAVEALLAAEAGPVAVVVMAGGRFISSALVVGKCAMRKSMDEVAVAVDGWLADTVAVGVFAVEAEAADDDDDGVASSLALDGGSGGGGTSGGRLLCNGCAADVVRLILVGNGIDGGNGGGGMSGGALPVAVAVAVGVAVVAVTVPLTPRAAVGVGRLA